MLKLLITLLIAKRRAACLGHFPTLEWERDITEKFSVMGTPSLQPFLKSYWLTPVQIMTSSRGSINAEPATITSESDPERRLAGREASTATTVMSRSRSQGTEVTIVTGDVPLRAFTRYHGDILHYGNDIQSRRERGYGQPVQVTHSAR